MTCNGCVASVQGKLQKLSHVTAAEVQLDPQQAIITMDTHIPTAVLQDALGAGKYTITDSTVASTSVVDMPAAPTSYYPIFLIFGYIAGITLLTELAMGGFSAARFMGHFMAGFFLLFSFFKLLNLEGFADGYSTYDIVAARVRVYGYIYPFIELLLGIAYLTGFRPMATNIVTLCIMGISTIGVAQSLLRKTNFQCACLGTIIKLPLSKVTLVEDLLMVAMSLAMILMAVG